MQTNSYTELNFSRASSLIWARTYCCRLCVRFQRCIIHLFIQANAYVSVLLYPFKEAI